MIDRVRAVICSKDKILLIERIKKDLPVYYAFPGGGVESFDKDLKEALKRECREELGVDI